MYFIEKNIPISNFGTKKPKGPLRLTIEKMEIGDSILVFSSKRGTAYATAQAVGVKIKTRIEDVDYVRIWRVK